MLLARVEGHTQPCYAGHLGDGMVAEVCHV